MKLAYILFDGITWLDLIGVYDPLSRLRSMSYIPDLSWDICATSELVQDNFGLAMKPTRVGTPLERYDAIIVPGGHGTRTLQSDQEFINWLKTGSNVKYKISICTGSLLLGAAGFLQNKRATTNYNEYEALKKYCNNVVTDRIVNDGNVITAGAVSASLDLGLYLCELWAGPDAAKAIRKKIDYHG